MPESAAPEPVFPLPLTAFERYMMADERPGHPMTAVFRVLLDGIPEYARQSVTL